MKKNIISLFLLIVFALSALTFLFSGIAYAKAKMEKTLSGTEEETFVLDFIINQVV